MSGGVDSSVAAARLVDAGHEVVGVHLALSRTSGGRGRGCCTLDDARDARRVADVIGIPFYVWDMAEEFAAAVMTDFVAEYERGRTPNPCMRCNERIKFSSVLSRATAVGFDAVATGHHARIVVGPRGRELHRGADADKDQSYVLGMLGPHQLARTLLPIGGDPKAAVRDEAARGLQVARKPDSHDICFIPDGDTAGFLRSRLGDQPGDIVDTAGQVLGRHDGAFAFTIGQRRGLALGGPATDGRPRYVVDLDIPRARVVVGDRDDLDVDRVEGLASTWTADPVSTPTRLEAQLRAHGEALPATVRVVGDRVVADLDRPIRGLAAGQSMVLYDGTRVVGSSTVDVTRCHRVPA
jgi:tRNA-specific 2-thiouridylase